MMASVMLGAVAKFMSATHMGMRLNPGFTWAPGMGMLFHRNGVPAFPRQHGGKVKWHRGWHFLFWFGRDPAAQPAERRPQGRDPDASSLIVSYRPAKYKAAAAAAGRGGEI